MTLLMTMSCFENRQEDEEDAKVELDVFVSMAFGFEVPGCHVVLPF